MSGGHAIPIGLLRVKDWTAIEPVNSLRNPGNYNAYIVGGPFSVALHGELDSNAVNPKATPEERKAAIENLPAVLSDGHIVGSKFSTPDRDEQTVLLKLPDHAVEHVRQIDEWSKATILAHAKKWNIKNVTEEGLEDGYEPLLKSKEGTEGYAMSVKFFREDMKGKIFVQNRDDPSVFDPDGTQFDMKPGVRMACTLRFSGIRIRLKPREYNFQKPIIEKIYIFSSVGRVAPDIDFGFPISIARVRGIPDEMDEVDSGAAAGAAATGDAVMTVDTPPSYDEYDAALKAAQAVEDAMTRTVIGM
jgi:hypothetical protein